MLRDTLRFSLKEPGIELATFWLPANPLYHLNHMLPPRVVVVVEAVVGVGVAVTTGCRVWLTAGVDLSAPGGHQVSYDANCSDVHVGSTC